MQRQFPIAAAPVLLALTIAPVAAPAGDSLDFADEVESCVAAVNANLDLENAERVRHFISHARPVGSGYALTIETSVVFRDAALADEQRFEAYCVARGSKAPSTFRMEAVGA